MTILSYTMARESRKALVWFFLTAALEGDSIDLRLVAPALIRALSWDIADLALRQVGTSLQYGGYMMAGGQLMRVFFEEGITSTGALLSAGAILLNTLAIEREAN